MQKTSQGNYFPTSYFFLKKLYIQQKQVVSTLVLKYFGRHQFANAIRTNYMTFYTVGPGMGSGTSFSTSFFIQFFKEIFLTLTYIK